MKLMLGDCLELMPQIEGKSVDMILCDLPYGTTEIEWDSCPPLQNIWDEYLRLIKSNGAIALFSAQPFTTDLINSNRKMFRYDITWVKNQPTGFLNAKRMPLRKHENILVFYKTLPVYNPQFSVVQRNDIGRTRLNGTGSQQYQPYMKPEWSYTENGKRYPTDVVVFSNWNGALFGNTKNATKHPTQKPIDLCEYLIKTYTNPGELVLDNCMGSGTTGIACVNTGRDFIGIEINPEYYELAQKRIHDAKIQGRMNIK
jgi:site-specific DNA-methyltransferase (adenine-specific)